MEYKSARLANTVIMKVVMKAVYKGAGGVLVERDDGDKSVEY